MSGVMTKKDGSTFKENPNSKQLDRPRFERKNYSKSTCISVGIEHGGGGGEKMQWSSKNVLTELWGRKR